MDELTHNRETSNNRSFYEQHEAEREQTKTAFLTKTKVKK